MTDSKWYAFKCWLACKIAGLLPESVKRFVLYELGDRVAEQEPELAGNPWAMSYEQLYMTLRD
jgi:hypothetical protein